MLVILNNAGLSLVLVASVATQLSILWQVPKEGDGCPRAAGPRVIGLEFPTAAWTLPICRTGRLFPFCAQTCSCTASRSFLCPLNSLLHDAGSEYNRLPGVVDRRRLRGQFWFGHPLAYPLQPLRLRLLVPTCLQSLSVSRSPRGSFVWVSCGREMCCYWEVPLWRSLCLG